MYNKIIIYCKNHQKVDKNLKISSNERLHAWMTYFEMCELTLHLNIIIMLTFDLEKTFLLFFR